MIGRFTSDIVYNKGRNIGVGNKNTVVPETPILIKRFMDGTLLKSNSSIFKKSNLVNVGPRLVSHIWNNLKKIEISFQKLSWVGNVRWTPEKLHNYHAVKRVYSSIFHRIWPHHTTEDKYEKFILQGNCKLADGIVDLGTRVVDYCLTDFQSNYYLNNTRYLRDTSPLRKNSFHNKFKGRLEYTSRYPNGRKRPRIVTNPKISTVATGT